jgi:hypothetical protein
VFSWRRADSTDSVDPLLPAISEPFKIKMAMINIAIQEDLPNVLSVVTGQHESFALECA